MHPQRELNRLAIQKADLQRTIALRRVQCAKVIAFVVRPLDWMERMWTVLGRVSRWLGWRGGR